MFNTDSFSDHYLEYAIPRSGSHTGSGTNHLHHVAKSAMIMRKRSSETTTTPHKKPKEDTWRTRTFKASWRKDFPWVEYDEQGQNMYCSVCRKHPNLAGGNSMFVGTSSFRLQNLRAHNASKFMKVVSKLRLRKRILLKLL